MPGWREIADRAIGGLGVRAGELVQIRELSGRFEVLLEMALAVERAGATPLPELTPPTYVRRLVHEAPAEYLAAWDRYRIDWLRHVDRVLVLQGTDLSLTEAPEPARAAWSSAVHQLVELEDERRLPFLLVAVPTSERADVLSLPPESLEARLLPALAAPIEELRAQSKRVLARVQGGQEMILRSAGDAELRMSIGGRRWLADDGWIDAEDQRHGGHVSNLPAGSVYTAVIERSVNGQLLLPRAGDVDGVRLTFEDGRIIDVADGEGRGRFVALLEQHSGDRDRISHIGIGLNPYLKHMIGWTLVDEHVQGTTFVALGENRYLGGENQSSLNIDYALAETTLLVDGKIVVEAGRLSV